MDLNAEVVAVVARVTDGAIQVVFCGPTFHAAGLFQY
jgi:hypothetical protein